MHPKNNRGFTLLEVAVTLAVILLLVGSLLVPLSTQVEQRQIGVAEKALEEIRSALVGHAITYGYMPCPDTDDDGAENISSGQCASISSSISHGNLPWQTLGMANNDTWGNRYRYAVYAEYARRSPSTPFTLASTNTNLLRVLPSQGASTSLTNTAVAVVISHGRNGYGATNSSGTTYVGPTSNDEQENTNTDGIFVYRIRTDIGASSGEFDDIVTWVPLPILFNRMVAAGKLP